MTMGRALQDALDKAGVSQALLARGTGLSTKHVNLLVKDKAPLSVEVAVLMEGAFPKIKAFPLLMTQLRQDVARVKAKRKQLLEDANGQTRPAEDAAPS